MTRRRRGLGTRTTRAGQLSTFATVVNAGSDLSTARPTGAVMVIWQFDNGTVTGDQGENVVNGQDGDLFVVMPA